MLYKYVIFIARCINKFKLLHSYEGGNVRGQPFTDSVIALQRGVRTFPPGQFPPPGIHFPYRNPVRVRVSNPRVRVRVRVS